MKNLIALLLFLGAPALIYGQVGREVSGTIKDSTGNSVIAATVKLISSKDSLFTRTDVDGKFVFRNVQSSQFLLSVTSLGYRGFNQRYLFKNATSPLKLDPITLKSQSNLLNEVIVSGTAPVTIKEDTVEYRASDYPVRENSVVEDVIKKLPGVEVDKDGNVTTQGKSITRVRVNGKDFFDGDLKTATQNLPAEIIEKIQIVDDYGDQANASGIRDSDPDKILNITISPNRNKGVIANVIAGGGGDARSGTNTNVQNDGRYQLSGMVQLMDNDRQLSGLINLNNTNASLFDFAGGGNQRGGRFRSGGVGGGGGSGITDTKAGGLNFRDELSKKVSIYGSYSIQNRNTDTYQNSLTQTSGRDTTFSVSNSSIRNSNSINNSHRLNFNLEYKIDSLNYLKVSPSFNYNSTNSDSYNTSVIMERSKQDQNTQSLSDSRSPAIGGDLLYNHRFVKRGRNLSVSFSVNNSNTKNDQDAEDEFRFYNREDLNLYTDSVSNRRIYTNNERFNTETNVTYSEPIGIYSRIDLSYNYNRSSYDNSRITELDGSGGYVPVDSLSNVFDYSFTTNRFGLSYRYDREKLYNFSVGVSAQPSLLEGYSESNDVGVRRKNFNFFPNARFVYNFAKSRSLNINYSGRSSEPSYNQIQPVVDLSNPQRPIVGNPDLKSAFNQTISIRYNNFDPAAGTFFIVGLGGNIINDRITSNLVRYQLPVITATGTSYNLIQETQYLNVDGYYAANGFYSWSKPFSERKYTLRLNGSANYTNDVSYNDNLKNIGKTWSLSQGLRMQINPNENIDITPGTSYRHSWVNYSLPTNFDTKNTTWTLDLNARIYFLKTFIFGFDGSKNINKGYSSSITSNPFIINTYLEKQFFNRRGRLRFQGYDLLNEARNVTASTSESGTYMESSTNRLTRYFMFSFAYRLNRFGGVNQSDRGPGGRDGERRREGGFRPEGGPPGGF
ncbi:outer membrane receptor protein involved in Fe transport [Arcticibacter tournemirensis]|uniref:Outer membrane beta-barrel protein n=1 Tax=Arcticibacter tournemirensis TaxID=699437 RepID=A0A5M9GTE0_9SPHI|nr:outer membrane beta-barrel protein [Arcticibacter tournemirensis]KAA8477962.1 outer membrane beta-barrel protein [Arcticibacter tournemirensis]TQM48415.1 outer membrane receptor protein involved in Fe transport [Arcticibacter tournemirensis]